MRAAGNRCVQVVRRTRCIARCVRRGAVTEAVGLLLIHALSQRQKDKVTYEGGPARSLTEAVADGANAS